MSGKAAAAGNGISRTRLPLTSPQPTSDPYCRPRDMTSVVFTTVSKTLKDEFSKVQEGLKDVESSIRKLTGRQPDSRFVFLDSAIDCFNFSFFIQNHSNPDVRKRANPDQWNDGVKRKRISSFIRQESPPEVSADTEPTKKPALMSTIVTKAPATKPIKVVTESHAKDGQGLARNKRMFGMILGTLQKFQSEESRRSCMTQRREEIEKKVDQEAEQEKANVKKERTELFRELRDKQATERKLQQKIERIESQEMWEKSQAPLSSFIQTKAKPCIFYLPKKMTPESEKKLKDTKDKYRMIIAEKRAKVQKDLNDIEELYQKEVHAIDGMDPVNETSVSASQRDDSQQQQDHDPENDKKVVVTTVAEQDAPNDLENGNHESDRHDEAIVMKKVNETNAAATPPDVTGSKDFEPNYDE